MKFKYKHPTDRMLTFILLIIIALMVAVLWGYGQRLDNLTAQLNGNSTISSDNSLSGFPVKVYVRDAAQLLYPNQTVVDAQTNRVYVPELRLSLPLNQLSRDLRYGYSPADSQNKQAEQASFQSQASLGRLIDTFSDVPCQQRLVGLAVDQKGGYQNGGQYAGAISLADGRTLYLYANQSNLTKNCNQFWGNETPDAVVALFKQAQSY